MIHPRCECSNRRTDCFVNLTMVECLFSMPLLPGNEKRVMRMMNAIAQRGPEIAMRKEDGLHSSGHAYREELSEVLRMLHPEHFLPVHGRGLRSSTCLGPTLVDLSGADTSRPDGSS